MRRHDVRRWGWWSARLPQLLTLALLAPEARATTLPSDKQALLDFKGALTSDGGVLASWTPGSDPCDDHWAGVKCDCADFFTANSTAEVCTQPPELAPITALRVLQLQLGDPRITNYNLLTGTVSPALGNLTELRVLNLNQHNLYGSIPDSLGQLLNLEQLLLEHNQLTGHLPAWLALMPSLRYVWLDDNSFTGPLPHAWCNGSWWMFSVNNNAGLCSPVPPCLWNRIISFQGTSLVDLVRGTDAMGGGFCGVNPPTCLPEDGCQVLSPSPPFWTNSTSIAFSFGGFAPPGPSSGVIHYRWAVGSTRWSRDVVEWTDFAGSNATQTVQLSTNASVDMTVFSVEYELLQLSLRTGGQYFVTVQAYNDGGRKQGTLLSSQPIVADFTPPTLPDGASVYSGESFSNAATQARTDSLSASWDRFSDPETGVKSYSYQVFQWARNASGSPGYVGKAATSRVRVGTKRTVAITGLQLHPGSSYFVRVYATNGAGLEGYRDAPPVLIDPEGSGATDSGGLAVATVVGLVAAMAAVASATVAVLVYWWMRERMRRAAAARQQRQGQVKLFKSQMAALTKQIGDTEGQRLEELRQLKELAFVITDLESSTAIAAANPSAFEKVQEMHDSLMRDQIVRFGGYEINTEGDAFHVAFKDMQSAVAFCMECQYQLMEQEWPQEVLRLSHCKEVRLPGQPQGGFSLRGPRVRMGVHWAAEGTVVQRLHQLTKHRIFTGPAFQVTRDLCEAAQGGQVLLSHEGWVRLREDMPAALFPVVEQLGRYKVDSWPSAMWVYQVTHLLGRPLYRQLSATSALQSLVQGWGLSIMPPPLPFRSSSREGGKAGSPGGPSLAFVAARLALDSCCSGLASDKALQGRKASLADVKKIVFGGSSSMGGASPMAPPTPLAAGGTVAATTAAAAVPALVSPAMGRRMHEALASVAMQFQGCIFCLSESQGAYLAAFPSSIQALRYCHAAQLLLMYSTWPADCKEYLGATEYGPDGKLLFQGPRVAMAVHESSDYAELPVSQRSAAAEPMMDYIGAAPELVTALSEAAHGGQVVLSEAAWAAVQDKLPGQPRVVSLGTHVLCTAQDGVSPSPQALPGGGWGTPSPHGTLHRCMVPPSPPGNDKKLATAVGAAATATVVAVSGTAAAAEAPGGKKQAPSVAITIPPEGEEEASPMLLMEVMPQVLARRSFPPPLTARMVEPGFRQAPDCQEGMAIVYVKVSKPREVAEAEQVSPSVSDETIFKVITAYNVALNRSVRLMRSLLPDYGGYECKEPEPGKLTLAFRHLPLALGWACRLQQALLSASWSDDVLSWEECTEQWAPDADVWGSSLLELQGTAGTAGTAAAQPLVLPGGGPRQRQQQQKRRRLWRGLRVKVGIAYGHPTSKAALNTGRADYYGPLPNLAARLMAAAAPGQVLVEGRALVSGLRAANQDSAQWVTSATAGASEDVSAAAAPAAPAPVLLLQGSDGPLELCQLGYYQLKGLEEPQLVFQAQLSSLRGRRFKEHPALLQFRPASGQHSGRRHLRRAPASADGLVAVLGSGPGDTSPRHSSLSLSLAGLPGLVRSHSVLGAGSSSRGGTAEHATGQGNASARQHTRQHRIFGSISRHGSLTVRQQRALSSVLTHPRPGSKTGKSEAGHPDPAASDTSTPTWLAQQQQLLMQQRQRQHSHQAAAGGSPAQRSWLGRVRAALALAVGRAPAAATAAAGSSSKGLGSPPLPTSRSTSVGTGTGPGTAVDSGYPSTYPSFSNMAPAAGLHTARSTDSAGEQQQLHRDTITLSAVALAGSVHPNRSSSGLPLSAQDGQSAQSASFPQQQQQQQAVPFPGLPPLRQLSGATSSALGSARDGSARSASQPRHRSGLRDATDWSYPGSTLATPVCQDDSADAWEAGVAAEAGLGQAQVQQQQQQQSQAAARAPPQLDSTALATAHDSSRGAASSQPDQGPPAFSSTASREPAVASSSSRLFSWQPPQPPGPSSSPEAGSSGATSSAAPGHHGGNSASAGSSAPHGRGLRVPAPPRRPQQLQLSEPTLGTGLGSPELITPGVEYAQQIAQLFVDGRRRTTASEAHLLLHGAGRSQAPAAPAAAAGLPQQQQPPEPESQPQPPPGNHWGLP